MQHVIIKNSIVGVFVDSTANLEIKNSTITNTIDFFQVSISSSCPGDYTADFSFTLSTQGGIYPYKETIPFSMLVGAADSLDPTGPDDYGYYAYSSEDTLYEQSPVYNWIEIARTGTEINIPTSDYTTTVNIPLKEERSSTLFFEKIGFSTNE